MVTRHERKVLAAVYSLALTGGGATVGTLSERLGLGPREVRSHLAALEEEGLVALVRGRASVTRKGRRRIRVVFIGGGFEVIHYGHIYTISKARSLGDVLVVAVARDGTIRRRKHREPVSSERERVELLSSLRQVDAAILGVEGDIYETLERASPDLVVLGYDQHHVAADIEREAKARGVRLKVMRLDSPHPGLKTSSLLNEL